MTLHRLIAALVPAILAVLVAGCGDQPVVYKQGLYQGKPDSKPWDNDQFKGSQVEWEKVVKSRTQGQDEYTRAVASAK